MTSPGFTLKVFGLYAATAGAALLLAPALALAPLGIAAPQEVWIRVVGALALVVGGYYWVLGKAAVAVFVRASVYGRIAFCLLCGGLVLLAAAPPALLLLGAVDVAGALWTAAAARRAAGVAGPAHVEASPHAGA